MAAIGVALEGTPTLFSVAFELASVGYSVHEHFATGTAEAYVAKGPREPDGRWDIEPSDTAEFATRLVVYRPSDPIRANGTVIVEWLNVTGGLDVPAVWMPTHRHLIREGYTWVGVSAQLVGIEGGGMMPGIGLRTTDPERYGSLRHPGDAYSFDIFTQIGCALRTELSTRYGLRVDRMIAAGASQSAFHLTTYVNAFDPRAELFDAFLLQGRGGSGVPVEGWEPLTMSALTDPEVRRVRFSGRDRIRDDVRVPVMIVQSETDVLGVLAYLAARQPDHERLRLWEVAGASHCDTYFLCASPLDSPALPVEELAALVARANESGMPTELPINSGPQMHFVLQRAFDALDAWIRDGSAPPTAARLAVDEHGALGVDELGIARGGVRTPWVDVPTSIVSGLGQPGAMTELFGTTRPIADAALARRYPGGRDDFVEQFRAATRAGVDDGFLVAADVPEIEAIGIAAWPAG